MEFESAGARKQVIISCFYFCSSQIALISRQLADRRQQADDDLSQDLGVDGPSLSSLAPLQVSDPVSQCLRVLAGTLLVSGLCRGWCGSLARYISGHQLPGSGGLRIPPTVNYLQTLIKTFHSSLQVESLTR